MVKPLRDTIKTIANSRFAKAGGSLLLKVSEFKLSPPSLASREGLY